MGFLEALKKTVSYDMLSLGLDIILFLVFMCVALYMGYRWYNKKNLYKYPFIFINRFGDFEIKKAKIVRNKNLMKKFCLEGLDSPEYWVNLEKEPVIRLNGVPHRVVCADGQGSLGYTSEIKIKEKDLTKEEKDVLKELVKSNKSFLKNKDVKMFLALQNKLGNTAYIEEVKIDKKLYMDTSLDAVEKSLIAESIQEANEFNPVALQTKVILGILVILLISMGFISWFNGKAVIKMSNNQITLNKQQIDLVTGIGTSASIMKDNNALQLAYLKALGVNYTIEYELTGGGG